jgi:hypothetical protein
MSVSTNLIKYIAIAAIAYGDETYIPGKPWNMGIGVNTTPYQLLGGTY